MQGRQDNKIEVYRHLYIYIHIHVYTTSELGTRLEQKKVGAEAGAAPVFALKWLANAFDANVCAYKILYKAEEKKKRQSVQSKAGTDGGLAGPVAPSRQKKDSAFKETQGQDCHDSYDGDLRPRPLQLQWLCAKVPRSWHAARQAIQVHLSVHRPRPASSSAMSAQRPEKRVMSPMQATAWVTGNRHTGREYINGAKGRCLRACAATKVEDLI